jgi:hypothetical protein
MEAEIALNFMHIQKIIISVNDRSNQNNELLWLNSKVWSNLLYCRFGRTKNNRRSVMAVIEKIVAPNNQRKIILQLFRFLISVFIAKLVNSIAVSQRQI